MNKLLSLLIVFCLSLAACAQHTDRFSIYALKGKVKMCEFYDEEGLQNDDNLEFDRAGRLINVRNHPLNWNFGHHKRDAQGRIISIGDQDNGLDKYIYNTSNKLTQIKSYYSDKSSTTYKYDAQGRIISTITTYKNGTQSSIEYTSFIKTDSHGNWTRANVEEITPDGERVEYVQVRRLSYFQ